MPEAVPNYLFTDAAGVTRAVFAGGVQIEADPSLSDIQHTVTWTNGPNGAAVAQIGAGSNGLFNDLRLLSKGDAAGATGYSADIRARAGNSSILDSSIIAEATGFGGAHSVMVARSDGESDFPQISNLSIFSTSTPYSANGFTLQHKAQKCTVGMQASGFCTVAGTVVTFQIFVDGQGFTTQTFAFNIANTHLMLPWVFVNFSNMAAGAHTVQLANVANLSVDSSDTGAVMVIG